MKKLLTAGLITVLGIGLASAEQQQKGEGHQKLSDLENAKVMGSEGDELGEIEDVVVDLETGATSFVIVADQNDERRPVPIASIEISGSGQEMELTLDASQQELAQAPSIQPEEVAELSQEQRAREIFDHFGEDYQAHQQQQMEFAAPPQQRQQQSSQGQQSGQQAQQSGQQGQQQQQQLQQQLEQAMTEAGVESQQAQQEAQKLAQKFSQEQPDQQQIQQELEQALTQAGVEQQKAQQEAQSLSQQVHQQVQFGSPQQRQQQQPSGQSGQQGQQQQQPQTQRSGQQQGQAQQQQGGQSAKLGQDLTDATVVDRSQEEIGQISDLLINLEEGYVSFVLIEPQEGEDQYAVSPRALEEAQQNQFRLNISSDELQQAQTLSQQDVQSRAQEQQQMQTAQIRQSPEVFRFQEEGGAVFGTPGREREQPKKDEEKKKEEKEEKGEKENQRY